MRTLFFRGLGGLLFGACALTLTASVALAQTAPVRPDLESVASEAAPFSILSDALWTMGSDAIPEPLETAQTAAAADPRSPDAQLRLGLALRMERPEAVAAIRQAYEAALRLEPRSPRALGLLGELLSYEGDAEGVERTYRTWLGFAPKDPGAHLSHALALGRLGRTGEARAALERSLALGPTPAAYVLRTMLTPGQPPEAILADYDRALALGGEARIYRWRARLRSAWGQDDLALADVAKALAYAPKSFRLRQMRAQINADLGRYTDAVVELDVLIAAQPRWPDLHNDRCWARARAGLQLAMALVDCDTALGLEPDRLETLDSRGLVKLRLGDWSGAIADYDATLKQDPEQAVSLFGRGLARRWSGDRAGGDADLDKARALDPGIDEVFAQFGLAP